MALAVNGNGTGTKIDRGVFVDSGKIIDVGVLNGVTPEGWEHPIEMGVKLFLEIPGLSFNPEVMVFGNVKRDAEGRVSDWGSAFCVRDLLHNVAGFTGVISDSLDIPQEALKSLIGKKIQTVRYVYGTKEDGKAKYRTLRNVFAENATQTDITEFWQKQRSKGYPKDYNPESIQSPAPAVTAPANADFEF